MKLPHIGLHLEESGSRILHLLGFLWALVDSTFCNSMVIGVKGTLFCLNHWVFGMLRIETAFEYEYVGLHIQTINGFLIMGPDITVS